MANYKTATMMVINGLPMREAGPTSSGVWTVKGRESRHMRWTHAYLVACHITDTEPGTRSIPCILCGDEFDAWSEGEVDRLHGDGSDYRAGNIALVCWSCNWARGAMQSYGSHGMASDMAFQTYAAAIEHAVESGLSWTPRASDAATLYGLHPRAQAGTARSQGVDRLAVAYAMLARQASGAGYV